SSRVITSRSRRTRSAWVLNIVSNSRRTPWATPAASFISRAISSKIRLLVCIVVISARAESLSRKNGDPGLGPQGLRPGNVKTSCSNPDALTSLPCWPHDGASAGKHHHAAFRPAISRFRPRDRFLRAFRHPLVCAGLYRRHPARLALRTGADPLRGLLGRQGAADGCGL